MASVPTGSTRVFSAQFRPDSDSHFVSVGERHLSFWTVAGSVLVAKRPHIPKNLNCKKQTMLSIAFGSVSELCYFILSVMGACKCLHFTNSVIYILLFAFSNGILNFDLQ